MHIQLQKWPHAHSIMIENPKNNLNSVPPLFLLYNLLYLPAGQLNLSPTLPVTFVATVKIKLC